MIIRRFLKDALKKYGSISVLLCALIVACYLVSKLPNETMIERENFFMGTVIQIKISVDVRGDLQDAHEAMTEAFKEIERVESAFSVFQPKSQIYRINLLKKAEAYKASAEVFDLVEKSAAYTAKTSGAFDITVGPLVKLWRAAGKKGALPSNAELAGARDCIGAQYLLLNRNAQTISFARAGMSLDLGGVAKGYAVDRAVDMLRKYGIKNAIVNCGGDMYCLGKKPYDELWDIGIQHPRKKDKIFLELRLSNKAVTTSGDYERYKVINGKRYSHIIDPRNGYPIGDGVVSATAIADDAATADIWSTALCILGEKGLGLASSEDGVDALIVIREGDHFSIKTTDGFEKRYGHIRKESIKW